MTGRIQQEVQLLLKEYADLEYMEESRWVYIPSYPLPKDIWNRQETELCFQIPEGYPGQPPYGFYVPDGLMMKATDRPPNNYGPAQTPFPGAWGKFSWAPENWRPSVDVASGSNLLNFVRSFMDRFLEGA